MVEKCEFSENEILEMWILWKMRFQKGEFCKNWDFYDIPKIACISQEFF